MVKLNECWAGGKRKKCDPYEPTGGRSRSEASYVETQVSKQDKQDPRDLNFEVRALDFEIGNHLSILEVDLHSQERFPFL
jgi:hypothetical protein